MNRRLLNLCLFVLALLLLGVSEASARPRIFVRFSYCRAGAGCPQSPCRTVPIVEQRLVPVPASCPNCPRGVCPVGPEVTASVPACPGGCKPCDCPAGVCPNCLPARR